MSTRSGFSAFSLFHRGGLTSDSERTCMKDDDIKMGEDDAAQEYDQDLIFKHLWVQIKDASGTHILISYFINHSC